MISRRKMMVTTSSLLGAGTALIGRLRGLRAEDLLVPAAASGPATTGAATASAPAAGGTYPAVMTPNGTTLPWTMEDGCKTFRLIAQPVKREFAPGMVVNCWGYNGQTPGPTMEVVEGDRLRIYVTNQLPEPHAVHWHGMRLPNGMDGVAGLTQKAIAPGETYQYEFTVNQVGTLMYHPHFDEMLQMAMGMMGFLIIHPKNPPADYIVDRDFAIMLMEWAIAPGTATPNPNIMTDFNVFSFNSRVFPGIEPLVARRGDRVRIRLANLSMDNHPIHLHGHHFQTTATEAGIIPVSARYPQTTIDVPVGTTRDIEFVADSPGDWAFHCHKSHHTMNAMSHDLPNLIGVDMAGVSEKIGKVLPMYMPMGATGMGEMAEMHMPGPENTLPMMNGAGPYGAVGMGGMFTIFKVREGLASYADPGWYEHPAGTQAVPVKMKP